MACLNVNHPEVQEWINGVGMDEMYRQYINHNYQLPNYQKFLEVNSANNLNSVEISTMLESMLNLSEFNIEDISRIGALAPQAQAAFMENTFYFAKSADRLQVNEEAFHAIFQTLTSPDQRKELLGIAETLLNTRVKDNKLNIQEIYDNYAELTGLTGDQLKQYVLEEELAKEWVNWSTYDGQVVRESSLKKKVPKNIYEKVIESLKNFFEKLRRLVGVTKDNNDVMTAYFSKIKKGHFKTKSPVIENSYASPSLRAIILQDEDGNDLPLDIVTQEAYTNRIMSIYYQLGDVADSSTEGVQRLSRQGRIDLAIQIFNEEVLAGSTQEQDEALNFEFDDNESEVKGIFRDEIFNRLKRVSAVQAELFENEGALEDEMGGAAREVSSEDANSVNRYDSLPKKVKDFMNSVHVYNKDTDVVTSREFPIIKNVDGSMVVETGKVDINIHRMADPNRIFAAVVRASSNSLTELERLQKLILFSEDSQLNTDTSAFIDALLADSFNDLTDIKKKILEANDINDLDFKNITFLKDVLKAFDLWTRNNRTLTIDGTKTYFYDPNMTSVARTQLDMWKRNFEAKRGELDKLSFQSLPAADLIFQDSESLTKALQGRELESIMNTSVVALKRIYSFLGVNVSNNFIKYQVANEYLRKNGELMLPRSYDMVYKSFALKDHFELDSNLESLGNLFKKGSTWGKLVDNWDGQGEFPLNPYDRSFSTNEDQGLLGRLTKIARGNSYFDESVHNTTFLNAEGKSIYAHQNKTMALYFTNNVIPDKTKTDNHIESLLQETPYNRHFLGDGNALHKFYDNLTPQQRRRLQAFSYSGIENKEVNKATVNGITADDFVALEANAVLKEIQKPKQGEQLTVPYFLGYAETSNTRSFFQGYWEKEMVILNSNATDIELSDKGISAVTSLFIPQINRALEVRNQIYKLPLNTLVSADGKNPKVGSLKITEAMMRENFPDIVDVYSGFHTGTLKMKKVGDNWRIDHTQFLDRNKAPRGLTITSALNGYTTPKGLGMIYENLFENPKANSNQAIQAEMNKGTTNLIKKTIDQVSWKFLAEEYKTGFTNAEVWKGTALGILSPEQLHKSPTGDIYMPLDQAEEMAKRYNIGSFIINSMLNRENFHRFTFGDSALINKNDLYDQSKRLKGIEGQLSTAYTTIADPDKGVGPMTEVRFVQMEEAASAESKDISGVTGDVIDSDDAQSLISVDHERHLLHGLSKLDRAAVENLDILQSGRDFTAAQEKKIKSNGHFISIEKTRGYGPQFDLKTSAKMLYKKGTSYHKVLPADVDTIALVDAQMEVVETLGKTSYFTKPKLNATREFSVEYDQETYDNWKQDPNVVIKEWLPDSPYLHRMRLLLEGWREVDGGFVFQDKKIDVISPISAHKRLKKNIWDGNSSSFQDYNLQTASSLFYGRQVENPSGKDAIKDPTQQLEIITAEANDEVVIRSFNGEETKLSKAEVIGEFQTLLKNRDISTFSSALSELVDKQSTPRLKYFYETVRNNLADTGADQQMVDLFATSENGKPIYNPNLPIVKLKFENYIFSHFSKGSLSQKRAGDARAMYSPRGLSFLKKLERHVIDGQEIFTWSVIPKNHKNYASLAEKAVDDFVMGGFKYNGMDSNQDTLTPELKSLWEQSNGEDVYFYDELRHLKPKIQNGKVTGYFTEATMAKYDHRQTEIQDSFRYMNGVRIPSQDKATSANLEIVDLTEMVEGNAVAVAKEIQELAGSDFDIDKIFLSFYEGKWNDKGEFKHYQNTFEDFKDYFFKKNEVANLLLDDKIINNQELQDLKNKINELKDTTKEIHHRYINLGRSLTEEQSEIYQAVNRKIRMDKFKMEQLESQLRDEVLTELRQPTSVETYKEMYPDGYAAVINNKLLDMQLSLLTDNYESYSTTTDVRRLKVLDENAPLGILDTSLFSEETDLPYHSPLFDSIYAYKVQSAKTGIGAAVNTNLTWLTLNRLGMKLNDTHKIQFEDHVYDGFTEQTYNPATGEMEKTSTWISALITATTDEAKEGVLAKYNLQGAGLDIFATGLAIGIHPEILIGIVNDPFIQILIKDSMTNPLVEGSVKNVKDALGSEMSSLIDSYGKEKFFENSKLTTENIKANIRKTIGEQMQPDLEHSANFLAAWKILDIYDQNKDLVKIIRMKRGYGAQMKDFRSILKSIQNLGLDGGQYENLVMPLKDYTKERSAYDLKGGGFFSNPGTTQLANYVQHIIPETSRLLSKVMLDHNPNYDALFKKTQTGFVFSEFQEDDFNSELQTYLLGSMLRDNIGMEMSTNLLIGENSLPKRYFELVKKYPELRESPLFKKLSPRLRIDAQIQEAMAQEENTGKSMEEVRASLEFDDVDSFSFNSFAKLNPEVLNSIMDDYQVQMTSSDPEIRAFTRDLFAMYALKEGLKFSSVGIGKAFPALKYYDLSLELDNFMSSEVDADALYEKAFNDMAGDVRNLQYIMRAPKATQDTVKINDFTHRLWGGDGKTFFVINETDKTIEKLGAIPDVMKFGDTVLVKQKVVKENGLPQHIYFTMPEVGSEGFYQSIASDLYLRKPAQYQAIKEQIDTFLSQKKGAFGLHFNQLKPIFESFEQRLDNKVNEVPSVEATQPVVTPVETTVQQRIAEKFVEAQTGRTAEKHLPKELFKVERATQFIGEGVQGSSTQIYDDIYTSENLSNTGNYTENDVIYVSSNGKRKGRVNPVHNERLQGQFQNIDIAIAAGSKFIMDTASHLQKTAAYNIGEIQLAKYLASKGYEREDSTGIWSPTKPTTKPAQVEVPQGTLLQGEEINSYQDGLGFALTNPTHTNPKGGDWQRNWNENQEKWRNYLNKGIVYNGVTYKDVEEAYQKNKHLFNSGIDLFNQEGQTTDDLMKDLLVIKLQTYPQLVKGIDQKGGVTYLSNSTHQPTQGSSHWETNGDNAFITALVGAYKEVKGIKEPGFSQDETDQFGNFDKDCLS